MKKALIILSLILPLASMAQFKINLSISSGVSKIYSNEQYSSNPNKLGVSFRGGLETNYFFNSNFGIGTGAYYYYNKGNWSYLGTDMGNLATNSVSLPVNLYYKLNNQKLEFNLGASVNLRLSNKSLYIYQSGSFTDLSNPHIYNESGYYEDGSINLHAGLSYYFNKKTKIGFSYEAGIQPYVNYSEYEKPGKLYFLRNAYVTLSHNIFSNHFKDIIQKQKDKTALNLAPFKIDFSVNSGLTKIYIKGWHGKDYGNMENYKTGISVKEGFEINYDFKSNFGLGMGIFYAYQKSNDNEYRFNMEMDNISKAISIPFQLRYRSDLFRVGLFAGSAINFNLNKDLPDEIYASKFHLNKKVYLSVLAGCYYQVSKKIKLNFVLEQDVQPFYYYKDDSQNIFYDYYFGSMSLKLNYTLFSK